MHASVVFSSSAPAGAAPSRVEGTQQTGSKKVYGLELGLFADLYNGGGHRVPLRVAYTFTDGKYTKNSDVATGVKKGDVLEYTSKHMASAQIGWEAGSHWKSYASLNYASGSCTTNTCGLSRRCFAA